LGEVFLKAWQIVKKREIAVVEDTVVRGADELKIKVTKAALSSTDTALFEGKGDVYPIIPARAAIGLVSEAIGSFKLGEKVFIEPYIIPEDVDKTVERVPDVKVMGVDLDGFLRDYVSVPKANAHVLPEGVKDNDALFIEYIAIGIKTLDALNIEKGDYIAIAGAGTLGTIIAQLSIYYQAIPILIDTDSSMLSLAESFGIYYTINPTLTNAEQRIKELTSGRLADHTVYSLKCPILPYLILEFTKDCGNLALTGYNRFVDKDIKLHTILKKQLSLVGIGNGVGEIQAAINMLATKVVRTEGLVGREITPDEIPSIIKEITEFPLKYTKIIVKMT